MAITPAEKRDKLLTLQARTQTADATGQLLETWSDVARVWASVRPLAGRELLLAKQAQARLSHRITILYRAGITPTMRAVMGSRVFHFESVINRDEANEELLIEAVETV